MVIQVTADAVMVAPCAAGWPALQAGLLQLLQLLLEVQAGTALCGCAVASHAIAVTSPRDDYGDRRRHGCGLPASCD